MKRSAACAARVRPVGRSRPSSSSACSTALAAEPDPHTTRRAIPRPTRCDVHVARLACRGLEVAELARRAADRRPRRRRGLPGPGAGGRAAGARTSTWSSRPARKMRGDRAAGAGGGARERARGDARAPRSWGGRRAPGRARGLRRGDRTRAWRRCAVLVEYAAPLLRHGGVLVAWKGAPRRRRGAARRPRAAAARWAWSRAGASARDAVSPAPRDRAPARAAQGRAHPAGVPAPAGHGAQAAARSSGPAIARSARFAESDAR